MLKQYLPLSEALNRAPFDLFQLRVVLTVGIGFFTVAYDLFIVTPVLSFIEQDFHVKASSFEISAVSSSVLLATCAGAIFWGALADKIGRSKLYTRLTPLLAILAIATALAPNIWSLIVLRALLGLIIGGIYPLTAVLVCEYANAKDRGKLVGMAFAMQAVGTVIGPMIVLIFLASNISPSLGWHLLLGLGAVPALAAFLLGRTLPESPRFVSRVQGNTAKAASEIRAYSRGTVEASTKAEDLQRWHRLPRYLLPLIGTAGTWFVFDYAYYGNSIASPLILHDVAPDATLITKTFWTLVIFLVAAVPGYVLAFNTMDRIGHKRLQWIGFLGMGLAFLAIGLIPGITSTVVPFLLIYSISYFFAEFGPNTTTFVMSAELFPVNWRATAHGIAAGVAKFGAFLSVFVFQFVEGKAGLSGALEVTCVCSIAGCLLTLILPEPAGRTLEEVAHENLSRSAATVSTPAHVPITAP
jgi:MFS family permease